MSNFDELEFLKWFFAEADFGPAHSDVMAYYFDQYEEKTGQVVPKEYDWRKNDGN